MRAGTLGWQGAALLAVLVLDPGFLTLGEATRRLVGAGLVALWMLWAWAGRSDNPAPVARWPRLLAAALLVAILRLPDGACGAALGAALLLSARGSSAQARGVALATAWATGALGVWRCAVQYSALGWQIHAVSAEAWSHLIRTVAGVPVRFGGDVVGLPILIAFLAAGLARAARVGDLRYAAQAVAVYTLLALATATAAHAALVHCRPESPVPAEICVRQLLLFAALLPTLLVFPPRETDHPGIVRDSLSAPERPMPALGRVSGLFPAAPPGSVRGERPASVRAGHRALAAGILGACVLAGLALWMRQPAPVAGKRVGIYTRSSALWQRSADAAYGSTAAPLIGDCGELLAALGCHVERLDGRLDAAHLARLDALVLPTPTRPFSPLEQAALERFVRQGGGLMAVAEHTDLFANRRHLNPTLRRFGIVVNNDSAAAVPGQPWRAAIAVRPHPILPGDATPERHGLGIGASLAVSLPAQPLLVGRGLFSDRAAPGPELGNLAYERPERLGDVIVAATATVGRGRVFALGDPSPLMNYSLHAADAMLRRTIGWLTGGLAGYGPPVLLGFALLAGLALFGTSGPSWGRRFLLASLAGPLVTLAVPTAAAADRMMLPPGEAALIDFSHREALATGDYYTLSTAGLARGLRRAGYLPSRMDRFDPDAVARVGALILLSPTRDFSARETHAIERMLARGGTLLVAMGWQDQPPVPALTRFLGVRVTPIPLGPVTARMGNIRAHFPEAWALEARNLACRTVCARWGRPIILEARRGTGRILVLGDPSVLLGDHLEGHERYDPGNIALLQTLIRRKKAAEVK